MIYFIFWVVLIVAIAASVPVVNAIEKKKRLAAMPKVPEDPADDMGEPLEGDGGFGDAEMVEEQQPVEVSDDFGAFDEEFK